MSTTLNNISSDFLDTISGIPQGSIAGAILFNVFINYFFYFVKNASVLDFADDMTITKAAINWFSMNNVIANPNR